MKICEDQSSELFSQTQLCTTHVDDSTYDPYTIKLFSFQYKRTKYYKIPFDFIKTRTHIGIL
jgi:hypothetical protein